MEKLVSLCALMLVGSAVLTGCSNEAPAETNVNKPLVKADGAEVTPVVFANEKGEALCPVMGDSITDTKDAEFVDFEGKRYYFCCGDCPEKFRADPAKYADGKAMPKEGSM
jgi:YHS domain-containing protein